MEFWVEDVEIRSRISNEDLPRELSHADIFALPSLFEGNPKALLEAMGCGLACIASDISEVREIVRHGENGYLCGTSPESIRDGLIELLGDSDLRRRLGEKARATIVENYSLEKSVQNELWMYDEMAECGSFTGS